MFYKWSQKFLWGVFKILGMKVEGRENVPVSGPVLIAANHVSNWDTVIITGAMPRPMWYMGKAELFRNPFMKFFMESLQVFPIERGKGDLHAIRVAMGHLQEEKALGIFPEGTRHNQQHDLSKIGGGVGFLACKSNAVVVPVAVIGSGHCFPCGWFRPLKVKFGKPIPFELKPGEKKNSENFTQFSQNVMQNIYSML